MQCPRCQAQNDQDAKFCEDCGARLEVVCPSCGQPVGTGKKFCRSCGASLLADASRFPSPQAYTPKHLAEKILTSKSALEGERKQVTVLFADLKGSMELLADRDPEEARKLLDPVLEHMMEAVHRYEGTVNQVMGDGIMALFGAPLAHEDHAVRACYAALRMQKAVGEYAEKVLRDECIRIQIRVGLNSGEVVVRSIGSDLHMDYTAVGQTTHLAARMEQTANPGTVLVTASTLRLAEGFVQVQPLGPTLVKGLSVPIEVYQLTGASPARSRLQAAAARGLTTFVGRETETHTLLAALEQAKAGKGQVVAVVGEPGVGKSRLFWEVTHAHRTQGCLVLEATSVAYGKATTYLPVADLLKGYFQLESWDDTQKIREKMTGKLFSLDRTLEGCLAPLLWLLDVPTEDPEWERLDSSLRRQRLHEGLRRLLLRESQVQPLVLVFEDLQWVDGETQALLDLLVESLPTARLLVLVNYRPEYSHGWGNKTYYRQLRIDPLPAASAEELLGTLLGDDSSMVPLRAVMIARTEGNPLFLEESVQSLVETGVLAGHRGTYRLGRAAETVAIPATAQAILAARVDRLSPEDKRLLQTAAVIGKDIPYSLLLKIVETDEPVLRAGLARLQASEFLYEVHLFPEAEYTFKHALTQEVAYHSLLQERRRALHSTILKGMEALYADRLSERVERLADHAFHGAAWEKAVTYLRQAGRRALERSTSREAIAFFEQALVALQHLPERRETIEQAIDLRLDLRLALVPLNEYEQILNHLQTADRLARSLDDRSRLAWIAYGMTHYHYISHDQQRAVEAGERAIALSGGADFALQIAVNMVLGYALHTMGEFGDAIRILRKNVEALRGDLVRERFGLPIFPAVTCRERLVRCLAEIGEFSEGIERGEEGLALAEELDHPLSLTQMYLGLGHLYLRKGDFARAIPVLERGMAVAKQWHISLLVATLISAVGHAYVLLGRFAEGMPLLEEGFKLADSRGRTLGHPLRIIWLAEGHLLEGRPATALEQAKRALQLSRDHKEVALQGWALQVLGEIAAADEAPDVSGAEGLYAEAIELAEGRSMRPLLAHCRLGLGKLYRRTGAHERAQEHFTIATRMFREMDMRFWLEQTEAEIGLPG